MLYASLRGALCACKSRPGSRPCSSHPTLLPSRCPPLQSRAGCGGCFGGGRSRKRARWPDTSAAAEGSDGDGGGAAAPQLGDGAGGSGTEACLGGGGADDGRPLSVSVSVASAGVSSLRSALLALVGGGGGGGGGAGADGASPRAASTASAGRDASRSHKAPSSPAAAAGGGGGDSGSQRRMLRVDGVPAPVKTHDKSSQPQVRATVLKVMRPVWSCVGWRAQGRKHAGLCT